MDDILPEGVSTTDRESTADTTTSAYFLSELSDDYEFFNHGALFAFAEFSDPEEDPVNDWYASMPQGTVLIKQPFSKPIFSGISAPCFDGRLTWDNVICAVSKDSWKSLFPFLCGVVAHNPRNKSFYKAFPMQVSVLDPGKVERMGLLHTDVSRVNVTVFCISGNKAHWELEAPASAVALPRMVKQPPKADVIELADKVLAGDFSGLNTGDIS
jgi:hypothetical protein